MVCILCTYTLKAAADSKEFLYIISIKYRYTTTTYGRRCSSRNRLGEQNPDEMKTDRIQIIIIRVEKKGMHSAVCVPIYNVYCIKGETGLKSLYRVLLIDFTNDE